MTTIAAITLTLQPRVSLELPRWNGALMRDCFVQQMPHAVADDATPAGGRLPYTVSNIQPHGRERGGFITLQSEQTYRWRVTTLTDTLSDWALNWSDNILGNVIRIGGDMALNVTGVEMEQTTDDTLASQHTLDTEQNAGRLEIDFTSPTAFKHHDMVTSIPTPQAIFYSLVTAWNRFNRHVQLHPEAHRFADSCMAISQHRLRGVTVVIPETNYPPVVGGVGFCRMVIRNRDRYWRGVVRTLAAYGSYAGVGVRTGIGMGQMQMRE